MFFKQLLEGLFAFFSFSCFANMWDKMLCIYLKWEVMSFSADEAWTVTLHCPSRADENKQALTQCRSQNCQVCQARGRNNKSTFPWASFWCTSFGVPSKSWALIKYFSAHGLFATSVFLSSYQLITFEFTVQFWRIGISLWFWFFFCFSYEIITVLFL